MNILVVGSQIEHLEKYRGENAVRDQWSTARAEGRSGINCGFGFGEMGHKVAPGAALAAAARAFAVV